MDNGDSREKLEREFIFLKESFDAEVISREEFEKGRDRIEKKLKEIEISGSEYHEEEKKHDAPESENPKTGEPEKKYDEKIRLSVIQDDEDGIHSGQEQAEKTQKAEAKAEANPGQVYHEKKEGRFFKYAVVFVVLAIVIFFSYSLINSNKTMHAGATGAAADKSGFIAACNSDNDCLQEGKTGACINPGAKNAKCELIEESKTSVIVLNGRKDCFNCGTQRVLGILEGWFGPISPSEIDYSASNGRILADNLGVNSLPAYFLDENITKNPAFGQFKQAFLKKGNYYALSEDAAGSAFYFRRENIPGRLDFFAKSGDSASIKAESNLVEFLNNFKDVKFEKHLSNDKLAGELGISAFPAFLLNNRIKFSGVQPAETIKENYCKLNKVQECQKSLSKNLI